MDRIPIVFTFTNDFIVPAYIAVKSLIDHADVNTRYEIIIIHYDLKRINALFLKELVLQTGHVIRFKRFNKALIASYPDTDHWPGIVYVRLFLPEILVQYDKVIYSDVDVLFLGDLSEVYHVEMNGYDWGGIKAELNNKRMIGHKYFPNNKNKYIYMSGFMVCNLKRMREIGFTDIVRENIREYASELLMFDLDILNMSSSHIKDIPIRYAFLVSLNEHRNMRETYEYSYMKRVYKYKELEEERKQKVIIHYAGGRGKPWLIFFPDFEYWRYVCSLPPKLKVVYRKNKFKVLNNKFRRRIR